MKAAVSKSASWDVPMYALPLQAVELLEKHVRTGAPLTSRERTIAGVAVRFLEKILLGETIASAGQMSIVPDPVSLDVYDYTKRALASMDTQARTLLIKTSAEVLSKLAKGSPVSELNPDKVQNTRGLFRALVNLSLTHRRVM